MKRLIYFIYLVLVILTMRSNASACLCTQLDLREVNQWIQEPNRIFFSGTALSIKEFKIPGRDGKPDMILARLVTFKIDKSWKKIRNKVIKIGTGGGSGDCGFGFVKGEKYLVDATSEKNKFETDTCTATRKFSDSSEVITELNKWEKAQKHK